MHELMKAVIDLSTMYLGFEQLYSFLTEEHCSKIISYGNINLFFFRPKQHYHDTIL